MDCTVPNLSQESCCIKKEQNKDDSNTCCDNKSVGVCSYCTSVYIAVLSHGIEINLDLFFAEAMLIFAKEDSFLSDYCNKPFHPPKII